MKFLITLAARNLLRNKIRTTVSIIAILIAVMAVIFTRGLMMGILENTVSLYIQYDSGHLRIIDQNYDKKEKLLSLLHPVDGLEGDGVLNMIEKLEENDEIELAVPRIKFGSLASVDEELVRMLGWGVIPDKEIEFTDISNNFVNGRMVKRGSKEIVIGSGLSDKLGKDVGDKVTILYQNSFDAFKGSTFEIVGKIDHYLPLINERLFYIPLDQAQRILIMDGQATEVLIKAESMNSAFELKSTVQKLINSNDGRQKYQVQTWEEANAMLSYFKVAQYIYNVIYILLILLAAIVVINTMIMIVKERTREIGMMAALGLKKKEILTMFIIEGTTMGIIGSFLGSIAGGALTRYLSIYGIDYTRALQGIEGELLVNPILYPVYNINNIVFGFILGVIITTITCIIPARRAAKLEPNDALRNI
ncbi:MAG: FtsX-like permease family protein [Halanaerobiales bacterium]|nr:FtsX-like permease family protein [Halanaerobiales bacterium]